MTEELTSRAERAIADLESAGAFLRGPFFEAVVCKAVKESIAATQSPYVDRAGAAARDRRARRCRRRGAGRSRSRCRSGQGGRRRRCRGRHAFRRHARAQPLQPVHDQPVTQAPRWCAVIMMR